jgi:predicted outer membrane repeat protein
MDPAKLREYLLSHAERRADSCVHRATGKVIRAMVPMHTFGHPADMDGLLAVASDFHIALIEDAAESLGSHYHGRHTGTLGRMGTLSFNGNKTITTGGGGAILTDDPDLARRAKHLSTTAKLAHDWEYAHDEVGFNYRLPNLNAALGCAQLERLPAFLHAKRQLFNRYQQAFSELIGAELYAEPDRCHSNYWLQTLLLDPGCSAERDSVLRATNAAGLMTRPAWTPLHELAPFAKCPRMNLDTAQSLARRLINLPSSPGLIGAAA